MNRLLVWARNHASFEACVLGQYTLAEPGADRTEAN